MNVVKTCRMYSTTTAPSAALLLLLACCSSAHAFQIQGRAARPHLVRSGLAQAVAPVEEEDEELPVLEVGPQHFVFDEDDDVFDVDVLRRDAVQFPAHRDARAQTIVLPDDRTEPDPAATKPPSVATATIN
eukprot:741670-Prymnesium_polylepis.1